jgi:NNP family nitrate/nitrite transporter-like MFS transporter
MMEGLATTERPPARDAVPLERRQRRQAVTVLAFNTLAFTVCFACWVLNGALVTFLVDRGVYQWTGKQIWWLIGIPVLTGSLVRLPLGILTDRYGGRGVFGMLMLVSAVPMYLLGDARDYQDFVWASLGFGLVGGSFAVGIAYTSLWFPKERQGTALGIFGVGNAGAAVTSMGAPYLLMHLTNQGDNLEGWRTLPKVYAAALVITTVIFLLFTHHRKPDPGPLTGMREHLAPLKYVRVWRFGLYYVLVFGAFVALAQGLIPYYVNVYMMPVTTAGLLAALYSLPGGVIRALGGWMSDRWGGRRTMMAVLAGCLACCILLIVPRMDIQSPGKGVMAENAGTVTSVSEAEIAVGEKKYVLRQRPAQWIVDRSDGVFVLPTSAFWQVPVVAAGQAIEKKQLLARGVTHIYFQANVWIFTGLVFVLGFLMGVGKAAVYKLIPDYFPKNVGVVGGTVGLLGGLGGFFCPIIFGWLLEGTGVWTTCWMFLAALSLTCLVWMHLVVRKIMREKAPTLLHQIEYQEQNGVEKPA